VAGTVGPRSERIACSRCRGRTGSTMPPRPRPGGKNWSKREPIIRPPTVQSIR